LELLIQKKKVSKIKKKHIQTFLTRFPQRLTGLIFTDKETVDVNWNLNLSLGSFVIWKKCVASHIPL
jgi:hypothetical protein